MAKNTKTFEVTLRARGDRLDEILKLVARDYTLVSLKEISSGEPAPVADSYFAGGKKNKGIKGEDLLLTLLWTGPVTRAELSDSFVAHGFKATSASPCISNALAVKLIRSGDRGWELTETGKARAAKLQGIGGK